MVSFGPYSHLGGSGPLSPNFSLLEIFQVSKGLGLRVVIHLWVVLHFHWGMWQIHLVHLHPILGRNCSLQLSNSEHVCFGVFLCIYTLMSACSWVVGYQSCPLWQTADKFSWVRPTEGSRGREEARGWRKRAQVGGERQERAEVGVWGPNEC